MSNPRDIKVLRSRPAPEISENAAVHITVSFDSRNDYTCYVTPHEVDGQFIRFRLYDNRPGWRSGHVVLERRAPRFNFTKLREYARMVESNVPKAWPYIVAGNIDTALIVLSTGYASIVEIENRESA